ncbi:hypothetical protein B0I35DRAFT_53364 [Stachybotrys elegans]|uniref:N-acetyltransferase domain-containing protein n=1 Tax=Stachybotrys elegans TaxID=80388 RepID=A0A8K0SRT3_9HYPO|nr:hypothetical protein B0I35DRAFT_53364 [Stachybotrys elegans]
MGFRITIPQGERKDELSNIHLRAMESNELLHAQFPKAQSIEFLHGWLGRNTLEHMQDADKGVLVALAEDDEETMVSFIKWLVHPKATEEETHEEWPECCRQEYLDSYGDLTQRVRDEVMGAESYYRLFNECLGTMESNESSADVTFLCTDPAWSGQGAATVLLRQVQSMARADGMPIVLESTMPAVSFYQKLGFEVRQGLDMMLPRRGSDEATELYEERCMVWRP